MQYRGQEGTCPGTLPGYLLHVPDRHLMLPLTVPQRAGMGPPAMGGQYLPDPDSPMARPCRSGMLRLGLVSGLVSNLNPDSQPRVNPYKRP